MFFLNSVAKFMISILKENYFVFIAEERIKEAITKIIPTDITCCLMLFINHLFYGCNSPKNQ